MCQFLIARFLTVFLNMNEKKRPQTELNCSPFENSFRVEFGETYLNELPIRTKHFWSQLRNGTVAQDNHLD